MNQRGGVPSKGLAYRCLWRLLAGLLVLWAGSAAVAQSGPLVRDASPIGFFTNVATHLLKSELNLDLNRIQLYPSNQYSPSVHRLLQVAANLYDATANRALTDYPFLPSVFRPIFLTTDAGTVYIQGYEEVTNAVLVQAPPPIRNLSNAGDRRVERKDLVVGIPLIIGARKGFPNFNEFAMQTELRIARCLEFRRPDSVGPYSYPRPVNETNQMFMLSISNVFGVEFWNSYSNAYPRDLELRAAVEMTAVLTNEFGESLVSNTVFSALDPGGILLPANSWPGYYSSPGKPVLSFRVPLMTNFLFLTNAVYRESSRQFVPETGVFERHPGASWFDVPRWWVQVKARVRVSLVDALAQRIVDYVELESATDSLDLANALTLNTPTAGPTGNCNSDEGYVPSGADNGMWCTNRWPDYASPAYPTFGLLNQFLVCMGSLTPCRWSSFFRHLPAGLDERGAIDFFRAQFGMAPLSYSGRTYSLSNLFYAPFNPYRTIYLFTSWQANDPLVHALLTDLRRLEPTNYWDFDTSDSTISNLGLINRRYEPWGGNPSGTFLTETTWDPSVKDPRVFSTCFWDFPTNTTDASGWLGRVHRGTPWQTIYLKSLSVSPHVWRRWVGVPDAEEAQRLHPTNDWRLASLLVPLLSTNCQRDLFSINRTGETNWAAVLDGITTVTNLSSETNLRSRSVQLNPEFNTFLLTSSAPQSLAIAAAIDSARAGLPCGAFRQIGDLLAIPALSMASPFLNTNGNQIRHYGISESAYEAIPAQLLWRLRPDSIGSIRQTGAGVSGQFSGLDVYPYVIESSVDLVNWTPLATNYPSRGRLQFEDSRGNSPRYYRSVLSP